MSAACIEKATVVTHKARFIYLRGSKPACPCCRVILMEKEDPGGGGGGADLRTRYFFCRVWFWFSPSITAILTYSRLSGDIKAQRNKWLLHFRKITTITILAYFLPVFSLCLSYSIILKNPTVFIELHPGCFWHFI